MRIERPNKWLMFRVESKEDPDYRIFGTWSGGYLDGDSWRLNSGVVTTTEDDKHYFFKGHSGASYVCNKEMYGTTAYGAAVLTTFPDRLKLLTEKEALNVVSEMLKE